jgi:hypothetical protein
MFLKEVVKVASANELDWTSLELFLNTVQSFLATGVGGDDIDALDFLWFSFTVDPWFVESLFSLIEYGLRARVRRDRSRDAGILYDARVKYRFSEASSAKKQNVFTVLAWALSYVDSAYTIDSAKKRCEISL